MRRYGLTSVRRIDLVKWMDTKGIIGLSTIDYSTFIVPVRQRIQGQKNKITLQCPLSSQQCYAGLVRNCPCGATAALAAKSVRVL